MKVQTKSILFAAISMLLCATILCAAVLLPNLGVAPQSSVQTTATLRQTTSATPTADTRPTTVPAFTTSAPKVPTTTVPVTTVPVTTVPPTTTIPVTTVPVTTVPPTTVPVTTVPPATTVPVTTVPPATSPAVTVPPTTVPPVTTPPVAIPSSILDARNAFVYDCSSGDLLCAKGDMTTRLHPASITKLFTVYIALQYLDPSREVTVGTILDTIPDDASIANLELGDVLTVEQLIAGMLLPSGNDAAMVLAVEAGRIITGDASLSETAALAAFVEEMNRQAALLGLQNSHFTCPDGYADGDHYTCMADLLVITQLCIRIPLVRELTATPEYTLTLSNGRTLVWKNTNWLVREDAPIYSPYAVGLKTGFMSAAGYCLMSLFHVDGQDLIIGVFGCNSIRARFEDTLKLFDEFA